MSKRAPRTPDPVEPDDAAERAPGLAALTNGSLRSLPFVALLVTLLGAGMVGQLALNVAIQDQQLRLNKAQASAAALALDVSDKQARVYEAGAPGALASQAVDLGMVPNTYPGFIDLRTGQIVGSPQPVTGREMPALVTPAPSEGASPAPGASASPAPSGRTTAKPSASPTPAPRTPARPTATPKPTAKPTTKPTAAASKTTTAARPAATTPARR